METCLGLLKQPPSPAELLWRRPWVEFSYPTCPAELGKGSLAFTRVLATISSVYLYEDDVGKSQRAHVLRRTAQLQGLCWSSCKRKRSSLAGGCLWLARLPVKVTYIQGRRCVFALGCFGEVAEKSLVWAARPILAGRVGAGASKTKTFSWDLCWGRAGQGGVRGKLAESTYRHKWCNSPWLDLAVMLWVLVAWGQPLPGRAPLLSAALLAPSMGAEPVCPGTPLGSGPWALRGVAVHPGMLFKPVSLHVFH